MKTTVTLFWFRRDLRLEDNHALYLALAGNYPVVPIFIFDKNILETLPENDARLSFIHSTLTAMNAYLSTHFNSAIQFFFDTPINAFKTLNESYTINAVYANKDYEPYAKTRDQHINSYLKTINSTLKLVKDHVIFEPDEVLKQDSTPYLVYTPYMKQWISKINTTSIESYPSGLHLKNMHHLKPAPLTLEKMGFTASPIKVPDYNLEPDTLEAYKSKRNFPSEHATSFLSTHLRFGTISIRKIIKNLKKTTANTFLKELVWREFFIQILWHFPNTVTDNFKPKYDGIQWRDKETEFKLWCEGKTGYPIVDAGMRQLNATGLMHNRVRMVTASFLCKHLLIDWRLGEAYFAKKLLDFELSSNVGNWQWVAGTGVDAAPYFRIFNPITQQQKFDKHLAYIKTWVTDFNELSYPNPIVEHKFARERCLKAYKTALQ